MADKSEKNIQVTLKNVRLSFVHVFEPQEMTDEATGNTRFTYNLNALIPKKLEDGTPNPQVKMLRGVMKRVLEATWPGQGKSIPPERRCVRDGEPIDPDTVDEETPGSGVRKPLYDGYAGHVFLSANSSVKSREAKSSVQVKGPRKTAKNDKGEPCFPNLTEADGLIYSGCYANVVVNIYGYDGKAKGNPDRINASLEIVQFKAHGEAFGAAPVNAEDVLDEEDEDGDDSFSGDSGGGSDDLLG